MRQLNLITELELKGWTVNDLGDIVGFQSQEIKDPITGILDFDLWINLSKKIAEKLGEVLNRKNFPLILGGDCRMLIGIISAFIDRKEEICLLFLDGHADFHTVETSPTGDPADMELAVLTGLGPDKITRIAGKYPMLEDENILVCGIRAWDQISKSNIQVYDYKQMKKQGYRRILDQGIAKLPNKKLPLWVHLDVDVLNPKIMPVLFPERGGLSFDELLDLLKHNWIRDKMVGMSIACYHPFLDTNKNAGKRLVKVITDILLP